MIDFAFITGITGSITLVVGAAWPEKKKVQHPVRSVKNWLFTLGSLLMMAYSILGYLNGGSFFFILLQVMVAISLLLMMLDIPDRYDILILSSSCIALMVISIFLFKNYSTLLFVLGLGGVGFGYAFQNGSIRRNLALMTGSLFIALFSLLEQNWIFFWLNLTFAIFSLLYLLKR